VRQRTRTSLACARDMFAEIRTHLKTRLLMVPAHKLGGRRQGGFGAVCDLRGVVLAQFLPGVNLKGCNLLMFSASNPYQIWIVCYILCSKKSWRYWASRGTGNHRVRSAFKGMQSRLKDPALPPAQMVKTSVKRNAYQRLCSFSCSQTLISD
jgi:hypothetical protein